MSEATKRTDEQTEQIEDHLRVMFPSARVHAYRPGDYDYVIRVRVIDASFEGHPNVAEIWHRDLRWPQKLNRKTDLLGRSGKPPSVASRNSLSIAKILPVLRANCHRTMSDFCNAEGQSPQYRDARLEAALSELPEDLQADITMALALTESELPHSLANLEFEKPSASSL